MRSRVALCVAAALLSCDSATTQSTGQPQAAVRAEPDATDKPLVRVNGFAIDVKGIEPALPADLEPASDGREAAELMAPALGADVEKVERGVPPVTRSRASGPAKDPKRTKWIVQLAGPVHQEEKSAIAALGARIGDYLPDFAFVVSMDDRTRRRVEGLAFVRGAVRYKPAYKISRRLKNADGSVRIESGRSVRLRVRADAADGLAAFVSEVHGGRGKVLQMARDVAQVEVGQAAIAHLAQLEEVLWIEEAVPAQLVNDTSRWVIQTNVPGNTRISDQGFDGTGQIVGIGDSGLDHDMCWFRDPLGTPIGPAHRKVVGYTALADDYDGNMGHGTHVTGTVAGDQSPVTGSTTANGMAPKARVYLTDLAVGESNAFYPPDDLGELFRAPYDAGARIHTNSWGANINAYDTLSWSTDRFMWEHKDFLVLFANGNSGPGTGTVGIPAGAKDIVSVGATQNGALAENVASFSSNGTASDGRIKPTVTAPGVSIVSADSDGVRGSNNCGTVAFSGTSMATPTTAGAAALVRQYYENGYWPSEMGDRADGFAPSAALVKATLVNAAQSAGGEYTDGPIPSTGQGWGRINLSRTLRFPGDAEFLEVFDETEGLVTGASWTRQFHSSGGTPLKFTLVWTDYPGVEGAAKALVNDLDLEVTAPDGTTTYLGNAFAGGESVTGGAADRLNVEEQVLVPVPVRGYYAVRVSAYNVPFGPQPFALVVAGAGSITSQGFLRLDRKRYNAGTTIAIRLADRDLNANPAAADEAHVTIRSDAESAGDVVQLVETGPDTSIFAGTIRTGPAPGTPGDGIVAVAEGATITATYEDADDGTGLPATITETAAGDLTPPVISSISVARLGQGDATISWTTSEPASAAVAWGPSPALGARQSSPWLRAVASVKLAPLAETTRYYFAVEATDEAGNLARDDAGGALHQLTTPTLPPDVEAYSSRGGRTYSRDTVVFGTARDPSGVVSLTVNGQSIAVRPADGYFEIVEPLALGQNLFVILATDGLGQVRTTNLAVERFPLPDLVVESVSSPDRAGVGMPFSATARICDVGPADAVPYESWRIAWVLTDDHGQGVVIDNQTEWSWVPTGTCYTYTRSFTIGPAYGGQTFHMAVVADFYDDIWEENEGNNYEVAPNPITFDLPDLTVTSIAAPGSVGTMAPFDVTSTVTNVGLGGSYRTIVRVYLSTDEVITTADRLLVQVVQNGFVGAGGSLALTASVTLPCDVAAGRYWLGAIVDPTDFVQEANEGNNALSPGPSITVAGPDLEVVAVSGPAAARTGDVVTVHDEVRALPGLGGASRFKVGLYLSEDAVVTTADLKLGERVVTGLDPGTSSSGDTVVTIPTTWPGGAYYYGAIADAGNEVLESYEANNGAAGNMLQLVGPDLAVTAVLAPATGFTGSSIDVQDTVAVSANGGAAPAFDVAILFSIDPVITPSDTLIGWRHVPALQPGGSSTGTTAVTLPANLVPGTYYVGVLADDFSYCWEDEWYQRQCIGGDAAKEPESANNALWAEIAVAGTDLAMTEVSAPAIGYTGQPLVVRNTVTAGGGGAGLFTVFVYLSSDAVLSSADTYLGRRDLFGLPAGGSSTEDTSVTVPLDIAPGVYYVIALADSGNTVVETLEDNNATAANDGVTIRGADLAVTAVAGPPAARTGESFQVSTTTENVGDGSSPGFDLGLYLSTDATITTGDVRLASVRVASLAPHTSINHTTTVSILNGYPAGIYYLGAIADRYSAVREANKANNALAGGTIDVTVP